MSKHEFKPGDLIIFAYPKDDAYDDTIRENDWETARLGLVVDVIMARPNDIRYGDELLVLHDGERWSVPSLWCRATKVGL
jgi:hypothetical protein